MATPQMHAYVCHVATSQWIPRLAMFQNLIQQHRKVNLDQWMGFHDCANKIAIMKTIVTNITYD
jgi:hypothetical protein